MSTITQGQRHWNALQSVAGRPRQSGKGTPSSSCNVESTTCKRKSRMWLMRAPAESTPYPYVHSMMDGEGLKSTYLRGEDPYGYEHLEERTMPSTCEAAGYAVDFTSYSVDSDIEQDFEDSDDTDSDTDVGSDPETEAQYITIPHQSPWWKPPKSFDSLSFDTLVDSDNGNESYNDDISSSHSLQDVLQEQQFLVAVFHDELRRMIPADASYQSEDDWLHEVDAKLLLAPVEVFQETCMSTMTATSRPSSGDFGVKPPPDVPIDFEEDIGVDGSIEEWEWEYPLLTNHVSFIEPHALMERL